jgi:hypothetical protein
MNVSSLAMVTCLVLKMIPLALSTVLIVVDALRVSAHTREAAYYLLEHIFRECLYSRVARMYPQHGYGREASTSVWGKLIQTRPDACTTLLHAAHATGPRTLIPSAMNAIRATWLLEPASVQRPAVVAVMSWLAKHGQVPVAADLARETLIMDANYLPALSDVRCRKFMHKHSLAHKKARTNIC